MNENKTSDWYLRWLRCRYPSYDDPGMPIDFSGGDLIICPDEAEPSKTTYEDITWIDSYGTPHTKRARIDWYSRAKNAYVDNTDSTTECVCESLL